MRGRSSFVPPLGAALPPSAAGSRRATLLWLAFGTLTLLFVLDSALGGLASSRWLHAARGEGTLRQWWEAVRDLLGWRLSAAHIALLAPRRRPGQDEYGMATWASACAAVAAGEEPGWPLAPAGPFRSAAALCEAVSGLPSRLRLHTYALPARLVRGGLLPRLAPTFNRGYPVEEYTLEHMARGPFAEEDPGRADAFLLPVHPYSLRVAAFPADGLAPVQAAVAEAVELVKARHAKHWAARGGCDHVLVSAHDKGGRVAQTADEALIRRGVLIVNTADRAGNADEWGRYTAGKDVSGIPSFSTSLPAWAARLGACAADGAENRPILASFVGGSMGDVRKALFEHWRQRPWPALRLVHGHLSPAEYMRTLRASRFCLHVRGTQVQSPRLIEALLFGCVPVVVADTYDLPLAGLLDWSAFSVRAPQGDPAAVRAAVEAADYERLRRGVCAARRFFIWHARPQPGDAFWMTMLELSGRLAAARPGCNGTAGGGALGGQRV